MADPHRVVIVGGGFAGLTAARALRRAPVEVVLIDRRNFHLFQPLLYQVATGALSPANIASPLRAILARQRNARVLLGEVVDLDVAGRRVRIAGGEDLAYDTLLLAPGSHHHYFGKDAQWEPHAPGLKTVEDATEIRRRVLLAFELAERASDARRRRDLLTIVVVGGGPTGVELAGAVAELAHRTLPPEFRGIDPRTTRIVLIENSDRVLGPYPEPLALEAQEALRRLGVELLLGTRVEAIDADGVTISRGGGTERIACGAVLWGAGVKGSPLGTVLADRAGIATDRAGRVPVQPDLTVAGHPEILVLGDLAAVTLDGRQVPGVAQGALQMGAHAARLVRDRLRGRGTPPFRYRDKGNLATIGRNHAVADLGWIRLSGFIAWLVWVFVHIMYIVSFQNRVLVFVQWAWAYVTRNRSARLITGDDKPGHVAGDAATVPR